MGTVLKSNVAMIAFARKLGFSLEDDPHAPEQVIITRSLA